MTGGFSIHKVPDCLSENKKKTPKNKLTSSDDNGITFIDEDNIPLVVEYDKKEPKSRTACFKLSTEKGGTALCILAMIKSSVLSL